MIRDVTIADAEAICKIYNHYVQNTTITFEENPVSIGIMQQRISHVIASYPWLVLSENDHVLGYAYVSPWRTREAYRYTVESTIYLHTDFVGKGFGKALFSELIHQIQPTSIHAVIVGISLPNEPSVFFHEKFGFEKVAHFKQTGFKFNKWLDVGYWQLLLPAR